MKQNNLSINDLEAVLNQKDKAYCDNLFEKYEELQNIIFQTITQSNTALYQHNQANKQNNPFAKEANKLDVQLNKMKHTLEENTKALILQIEKHFRTTYNLSFPSILKTNPSKIPHRMASYDIVIENIINQSPYLIKKSDT